MIRFTTSGRNFGSYEDRIPALFVRKDGYILTYPSQTPCYPACPWYASNLSTWYKIDMQQYLKNNQYMFEVRIDNTVVNNLIVSNRQELKNVRVLARSTKFHQLADVRIRNLFYKSGKPGR